MIKDSFIEGYKEMPMQFALACDEIITHLEKQARVDLSNSLLREENAIAAELYTMLNSEYNYLSGFYEDETSFVMCSGVRVVFEEGSVYVRLRLPLPFPMTFTAVDLELPIFSELKFQLTDLRYRYQSLSMSRKLSQTIVDEIKACACEASDLDDFLSKAKAINEKVCVTVTKMRVGRFDIERRIANCEAIV